MSKELNLNVANKDAKSSGSEKKKKVIDISVDWERKIKEGYNGSVNGYIKMAIFERLKKDGWIK